MKAMKIDKDDIKSFGLVLLFVGMQLNTALKNVVPGFDIVAIIMFASFACLLDVGGLKKIKVNTQILGLTCFQIMLLIMALLSGQKTGQLISYHLFLIAAILALVSNNRYIEYKNFGRYMFYVSGFISLVVLYQATSGFSELQLSFEGTGKLWLSEGGDPITLPRAIQMNVIACLFYRKKNKIEKILTPCFILSDVIGLFSFSNRSTIMICAILFGIWIAKNFKTINASKLLLGMAVGVIVIVLLIRNPYFSDKFSLIYDSGRRGIRTLLGLGGKIDSSALSRIDALNRVKAEINQVGFIKSFLFGLGYNHAYLDRPIIQGFVDLGILGGLLYAYYGFLIPLKKIITFRKREQVPNKAWLFVVLMAIQTLMDQLITGIPYYFFLWTPTIFFVCSEWNFKKYSERKI